MRLYDAAELRRMDMDESRTPCRGLVITCEVAVGVVLGHSVPPPRQLQATGPRVAHSFQGPLLRGTDRPGTWRFRLAGISEGIIRSSARIRFPGTSRYATHMLPSRATSSWKRPYTSNFTSVPPNARVERLRREKASARRAARTRC